MKRVHVLRHVKSAWSDEGLDDHDRPLSPRGHRAVGLLAAHCARTGVQPDVVLCSAAARARATLAGLLGAFVRRPTVRYAKTLYCAGVAPYEQAMKRLGGDVAVAMVVGHNPDLQDLVLRLAATGQGLGRVRRKFPTGAFATIDLDIAAWEDLKPGVGQLVHYVVPADLEAAATRADARWIGVTWPNAR